MEALILRGYQERSLSMLYDWLGNNKGHVCINLPTGAGKSVVIAELCRRAITEFPETNILMLTRSMELIQQNASKLRQIWPNAPLGVYSASVGKRQLGEQITIGGPLSIVRVLDQIGHCDLLICDECHDIGHKDEGTYRKIINYLTAVNPNMRVIGYTASPYRLGHGLITDKPAIFDEIITPASIEELVSKGYLCTLRSKLAKLKIDVSGVHKRGGEFIESELQKAVDTNDNNVAIVDETIKYGHDRNSWLIFCTGVLHSQHIRDLLIDRGITAISVTGDMPKEQRIKAIKDFKAGKIKAITSVDCLSTGFDHPGIDLITMARPTMSPGKYIQCAGRGLRVDHSKSDCIFLDFAGVVETHGPITAVKPPNKKGDKVGEAPMKVCDNCAELVALSVRVCPACGEPFPEPEKPKLTLRDDDIMGIHGTEMEVSAWEWREHTSRASGNKMLMVTYYGALSDSPVTEYFPVLNDGYAGQKALRTLSGIATWANVHLPDATLDVVARTLANGEAPELIEYRKDGKFHRVMKRTWKETPKDTLISIIRHGITAHSATKAVSEFED